MTLREQAYAQAMILAGELTEDQSRMLRLLCESNYRALECRLRDGLTPDDCKADMVAAVSLLALADLGSVKEDRVEQITAGDFAIRRRDGNAAANCLRAQAQLMIAPYLNDSFSFRGV